MKVFNHFIVENEAETEMILYGMKIIASHFITVMGQWKSVIIERPDIYLL